MFSRSYLPKLLLVIACVPFFLDVAMADEARAFVSVADGPNSPPPTINTGPISAESSVSYNGMAASSASFLDQGVLRAFSASKPGLSESVASAQISALITFQGGIGQTAYLDYSFDGTLSLFGDPTIHGTFGKLLVSTSSGGYRNITLSYNGSGCATPGDCFVGTSIATSGSVPIVIVPGEISISLGIVADSQYGDSANFSSTGRFFLRTPDGVAYTSAGGQFLINASPVSEPASFALLFMGASALLSNMYRRKRVMAASQ